MSNDNFLNVGRYEKVNEVERMNPEHTDTPHIATFLSCPYAYDWVFPATFSLSHIISMDLRLTETNSRESSSKSQVQ